MTFLRPVEIGLLEDERHAEHAFPELDRGPAVGADKGDVMNALALQLSHVRLPRSILRSLDQFRFVFAPRQTPPRHEIDFGRNDELLTDTLADPVRKLRTGCAGLCHLD